MCLFLAKVSDIVCGLATAQQRQAETRNVEGGMGARQVNALEEPIDVDMEDEEVPAVLASVPRQPTPLPFPPPAQGQQQEVQEHQREVQEKQLAIAPQAQAQAQDQAQSHVDEAPQPEVHVQAAPVDPVQGLSVPVSEVHSPATEIFEDFDLEYPQSQVESRVKTPDLEPAPPVAQNAGEQLEEEMHEETEERGVQVQNAPTLPIAPPPFTSSSSSIDPITASTSSSSTLTLTATATTLSSAPSTESGCTLDKSRLHFSRVDWNASTASIDSPADSRESSLPLELNTQALINAPMGERVSATLPPPLEGSVAELRLGVVGCAPYVGRGLVVDVNDRLAIQEDVDGSVGDRSTQEQIPLVTRPSVSPLPSPATTPSPSESRVGTPVEREGSVSTVVVDEDTGDGDEMQVEAGSNTDEEMDDGLHQTEEAVHTQPLQYPHPPTPSQDSALHPQTRSRTRPHLRRTKRSPGFRGIHLLARVQVLGRLRRTRFPALAEGVLQIRFLDSEEEEGRGRGIRGSMVQEEG
ncbi:hypothetical protein NMY22_g20136 [Coprinellus aureogranulatus]|nr:hypothetical protein NMY22_g20136 [Coprinellus aureogranulatus]